MPEKANHSSDHHEISDLRSERAKKEECSFEDEDFPPPEKLKVLTKKPASAAGSIKRRKSNEGTTQGRQDNEINCCVSIKDTEVEQY